ncbi:MAG TPA: hypothetical protein VD835_17950 [Pyrinomonadaceae bacterium]|nr:hypothetical protein [Pyrinomonadaceae bacterium]
MKKFVAEGRRVRYDAGTFRNEFQGGGSVRSLSRGTSVRHGTRSNFASNIN